MMVSTSFCPFLNAATEGDTLEEARAMAKDLIESCIEAHIKLGRPIPLEKRRLANGERMTVSVNVVASLA